jgi:hypothetical protein
MNGALWTAFLAALAATKWPELSWVAGGVTAVMVLIAATVYCITPREDKGEHNRPEDVEPAATESAGVTAKNLPADLEVRSLKPNKDSSEKPISLHNGHTYCF